MAIRNSNLGGTDWSDGNVLYATDLSDSIRAGIIRASSSAEDTSEYSSAIVDNATWYDLGYSKTFTVPDVGANNKLVGFKFEFDRKVDVGDRIVMRATVTNNTTGTSIYLFNNVLNISGTSQLSLDNSFTNTTYSSRTTYAHALGQDSVIGKEAVKEFDGVALGSTYTITFEAVNTSGATARTVSIQNITITAYWTVIEDADVEGWA